MSRIPLYCWWIVSSEEKTMAPHSSTLAWKIPWVEEPGRLQSTGSLRVGHDWATSLSLFTFMRWRRKWQPTPVFLPGESQGGGAWWAAIYGVTQSRTRLKRLSSSSSILTFVGKVMSLLFNILSRFVIAFLPSSWLQSLSTVILEPKKRKSATVSTFSPSVCCEVKGLDAMI